MIVATAEQTRRLEQRAVDGGASWRSLMVDAGAGMARAMVDRIPTSTQTVLVLVGPGNNGGDGLVIAHHLHDRGARVRVYMWKRTADHDDWPRAAVEERRITLVEARDDEDGATLRRWLADADLVVDAVLGIGITRPVTHDLQTIIEAVNTSGVPIVAVDIASGIGADTGAVMGGAIRATWTLAAGVLKPGHLLEPGRTYSGTTEVISIGLEPYMEDELMAETLVPSELRTLLPARPADSNKGTFGKVAIIGGSGRYPGAVLLAGRGAQRVGAGLVTLAAGRSIYGALVAASHETTFLPLPEEDWGVLGESAATELGKELGAYQALVLGPGLGQEDATKTFVARLLSIESEKSSHGVGFVRNAARPETPRRASGGVGFLRSASATTANIASADEKAEASKLPPVVLDADALNILAAIDDWTDHLEAGTAVLTPHPGEMARLLKLEGASEVQADRLGAAQRAAKEWRQVVVLKGASTIIVDPNGHTVFGPEGNPALATAGTGDVLSGIIAGLIAQGLSIFDAAKLGVYLHAEAGALVREDIGDAGAVAGDLILHLPRAIKTIRAGR
jgi:ADP-dependent NAD(P)H-hydrate dehydratase / NAD(P)H-hydrate epimerase